MSSARRLQVTTLNMVANCCRGGEALLGCLVGGAKPPAQPTSESESKSVDELTEPARGQPRLARVTQPTPKASEA